MRVCVCVRGANFKRVAFCRGVRYPLNRLLSSLAHAFACLFIHLAPPSADSPARSSTRSFAPLRVTRSTKARARVFSSGLLLLPPSLLGRNQGDQIRGGESGHDFPDFRFALLVSRACNVFSARYFPLETMVARQGEEPCYGG